MILQKLSGAVLLWHLFCSLLAGAHGVSLLTHWRSQDEAAARARALWWRGLQLRDPEALKVTITIDGLAIFFLRSCLTFKHPDADGQGWSFWRDMPFEINDDAGGRLLHVEPPASWGDHADVQMTADHDIPRSVGDIDMFMGINPMYLLDIQHKKFVPRYVNTGRCGKLLTYLSLRTVCFLVQGTL